MKIVERLDLHNFQDDEGNVLPVADSEEAQSAMPNSDRIARMHPHSNYEAEIDVVHTDEDAMTIIRDLAPFDERNELLLQAAQEVAHSRRHDGAGMHQESGHFIPHYKSPNHAFELAVQSRKKARALGVQACESCALAEYCTIQDELTEKLEEPKARNIFIRRVDNPENNHLCLTNMQPGRQDNSSA